MVKRLLFSALVLSLTACSISPGIYLEKGQFGEGDTVEVKAPPISLIPITPETVSSQYRAAMSGRLRGASVLDEGEYHYRVGPQDILNIIVWEHPELTIPTGGQRPVEQDGHKVRSDGTIFYPYVGVVKVAGMTTAEIRDILTQRLSSYIRKPQLDVRVVQFNSQKVHISGAVEKPGVVPITDRPLYLADVVSAAGVDSGRADIQEVVLTRNGKNRVFDLLGLFHHGDLSQNIRLQDGDIVYIPANTVRKIYVMGEVLKPQSLPMVEGKLSLADALASAGVDQKAADSERIFVLRQGEEQPLAYHLDASEPAGLILATVFPLQPLDVVFVSTSNVTRWNRVLSQLMPTVQTLWTLDRISDEN
ncbi:MAG: polysaccharide biosynthesis/export family protein [Gammaproteobacteria bacterium]|nr:polysaccharide biosynthesis/export family protein [Gammaproteobacteria bacterium]MCW8840681.1 polysaccharide biosynthesis/export family protein [Gammaproteobacteria bacterium]MCW8957848.1 polysaccharide biosynthesis/export family protein [Gammaproteobacteria bacterium]MCW8993737.1 polysaccharide biosynthesis/export family protein [Gammaproteobacteria bacterium]